MNEEEYLIFQIEQDEEEHLISKIERIKKCLVAISQCRTSWEREQLTSTELAQTSKTDSPSVTK